MDIRFLTLAQQEVDDAVLWYNKKAEDVGREFLDEFDRAVRLVRSHPLALTEIESGIRRCLFARFPYALIYGIDEETVVVIAVAHLHRQPRYWAERIR
ncbi:MAG: type II toxin-antitoxin system RelE/ParE family toxin [Acidobacteriota bacterium]|nr:type II toxin-antitoxin system RelE/ParE family toxin [Acidobacteriota bacterium]